MKQTRIAFLAFIMFAGCASDRDRPVIIMATPSTDPAACATVVCDVDDDGQVTGCRCKEGKP